MGKDALSHKTTKEAHSSNGKHVEASPIIFILAIFAVIVIGLYLVKDKIFKKSTELPKSENIDNSKDKPTKPETITESQATEINDKFAELNK